MIPLLVFYVHVVAVSAGVTKRWQEEGVGEGILAFFFVALIFFVGWSISSFLMKLVIDKEGFGPLFDRDAASLLLLTVTEAVVYYFLLRNGEREQDSREVEN